MNETEATAWRTPEGNAPSVDASALTDKLPADRPEILVGGAFVGGLLTALILKRLGR